MSLPEFSALDTRTRIASLRFQYGRGLLGVPRSGLRLSWEVASADAEARQLGYQLAVGPWGGQRNVLPVEVGEQSIGVAVDLGLRARDRVSVVVRIATQSGWTEWSEPLDVEAGVNGDNLEAVVIGVTSEAEGPAPLLRKEFALESIPDTARLRLSALGLVDAWVNGVRVGDAHLTPGWTSYQGRILIDTHDVRALLRVGTNVIVLAVADGWYRGRMGFAGRNSIYGDRIGAIAQLEADDEVVVATDQTWLGGFGAVQSASIYDGTSIDLQAEPVGLHEPGFVGDGWGPVDVLDVDRRLFKPRTAPPVRIVDEIEMTIGSHNGRTRLDAQQNIAGWVRLRVRGKAGETVTVRHAEVVEPGGDLHYAALRSAKATDTYVLARDGESMLEPAFTFHGFQYAEVEGAEVLSATGVSISSDLPTRSSFRSSHTTLNQFHSNVFWSQRDNFVSLPTDCPQRDERLGWTGDAQAFAPTANTLMDAESFWLSWLEDLEIDQAEDGGVSSVVPDIIRPVDFDLGAPGSENMGRAGWADAATIVPTAVYEYFGSDHVLHQTLQSMQRWVDHLRGRMDDRGVLRPESFQYGDWLDPDAPGDRPWEAKVSSEFVANAFFVRSARLLASSLRVLEREVDADDYETLADGVATQTWKRFGEEAVRTQSGAAIALEFHIVPEVERARVAEQLAARVREVKGRIETGFLGTPLVLFALSNSGYLSEAYHMLLRREAPSWLYQVDQGATTVWERWDALRPDGSIHDGKMDTGDDGNMLSFNHYAYGAMIDWVYRTVAGIAPDASEPGYRLIHVAPRPAEDLTSADASVSTRLGRLSIEWKVSERDLEIKLEVPFGARALLDLPMTARSEVNVNGRGETLELTHGSHHIRVTNPSIAPAIGG